MLFRSSRCPSALPLRTPRPEAVSSYAVLPWPPARALPPGYSFSQHLPGGLTHTAFPTATLGGRDEKAHDLKERISLCQEKPRGRRSKKKREEGGRKTVFHREQGHIRSHWAFLGAGAAVVLHPPYLTKSTQQPSLRRQVLLLS